MTDQLAKALANLLNPTKPKQNGKPKKNKQNKKTKKSPKYSGPARPVNSKGVKAPPRPPRRGQAMAAPEGRKIVTDELRRGAARDNKNDHINQADIFIADGLGRSSEIREDIECMINPVILVQYIAGICYKTTGQSDRWQDYNFATRAIVYYLANMKNIGGLQGVTVWPRAIAQLAWALTPRRSGNLNYSAHWDAVDGLVTNIGSNGFTFANSGFVGNQCSGIVTGGYLTFNSGGFAPLDAPQLNKWQDEFFTTLDLVRVEDLEAKDIKNDASAFSFDTGGGRAYQAASSNALTLISLIGYNSGVAQYLPVNSMAGLETPIRRPHLAAIRLTTGCSDFGSPAYHTETVTVQRLVKYSIATTLPPSALGYQRVSQDLKGKLQLKWVPATGTSTTILQRLETLGNRVVSIAGGGTWAASFSLGDIQNLVSSMYKNFLKRYSGATIGVRGVIPAGTFYDAEQTQVCWATSSLNAIRMPEYVQKLLGAQNPYLDADGCLIPFVSSLAAPISTLTYTGNAAYATSPISGQFGTAVLLQQISVVYKAFEANMVAGENMQYLGQYGPTKMDVSFLRDANASQVTAVMARRQLSPEFVSDAILLSPALSYDIGQVTQLGSAPDPTFFNHTFRQHCRRNFSGFDTASGYASMSKYDGIVNGALTSNMSDATGPDNSAGGRSGDYQSGPVASPALVRDVKGKDVPKLMKFASRLIPRAGNYCGPMWTAGVDTGKDAAVWDTVKGKYIVPATDEEDQICKDHDEAYKDANGDLKKVRNADWEMVKKLRNLRVEKGISWYALGAELAIALKAGLSPHNEEGVKEYFGVV